MEKISLKNNQRINILLIDAQSLIFRAFFAIKELRNAENLPTNALYGLVLMLENFLKKNSYNFIGACFDVKGKTFRHEEYISYKATRVECPQDLIPQIDIAKEIFAAYGIMNFEKEGYEADDLIATLTTQAQEKNYLIRIVSGDKDLLQLVNKNVEVLLTKKGVTNLKLYNAQTIKEELEITPKQIIDYKALVGDNSDNIKGIPGIGIKKAKIILKNFSSIEEALENAAFFRDKIIKSALQDYGDFAIKNKKLITLHKNVPDIVLPQINSFSKVKANLEKLALLFKKLNFNSFLKKYSPEATQEIFANNNKSIKKNAPHQSLLF